MEATFKCNSLVTPSLEVTIERMQREIIWDMLNGHVSTTIKSFSQLHDFVDANCYGGLCDGIMMDSLIAQLGGRDLDEGMPQGYMDYMNAAQGAVNEWLGEGTALAIFCALTVQRGFDGYYVLMHKDGRYYQNGELVKIHNEPKMYSISGGSAPHREGVNGYVIVCGKRLYASPASLKWVKLG